MPDWDLRIISPNNIPEFFSKLRDFSFKMDKEREFWAEHDGIWEVDCRKKAVYGLHTK